MEVFRDGRSRSSPVGNLLAIPFPFRPSEQWTMPRELGAARSLHGLIEARYHLGGAIAFRNLCKATKSDCYLNGSVLTSTLPMTKGLDCSGRMLKSYPHILAKHASGRARCTSASRIRSDTKPLPGFL